MLLGLLRRALPGVLALGLLGALWSHGRSTGYDKAEAELAQYKARAAQANATAQSQISTKFQTTLENHARELQTLTAERDALLIRVRNRASRAEAGTNPSPGQSSATTEPTHSTACGPDQLYREDAEFLIHFASDAEAVRQELLSTRRLYESAREALSNSSTLE